MIKRFDQILNETAQLKASQLEKELSSLALERDLKLKSAQDLIDSVQIVKKKAAKKKSKKVKAVLDDDELFLDAYIAQDKTWPNKVLAAIGSIRHLTSSESDYKRWVKDE